MPQDQLTGAADAPIRTTAPAREDNLLRDKFVEDIAAQSGRMDHLASQLIAVQLAVPGIYAAALQLTVGNKAMIDVSPWLVFTFLCWAAALVLSIISLIPRKYAVDAERLSGAIRDGRYSIEGYFRLSALRKRCLLLPSCGLFFAGVYFAIFSIF